MEDIPKPIGRKDKYYSYLINGSGALPKPITREDRYLYYLCTNGFGSGGGTVTPEMVDAAVDAALKLAKEYTDNAVSNAGYSLGLNIDSDYIMTLELKNADDIVVSAKSVDFPIESMVVGASYSDGFVTLSLQNGDEVDVDVSDLVKGLVSDDFTIAGINMKDAITAKELKTALDVTAEDVGALPLTGGEMQGNISFESLEGDYKIMSPATIQMKHEGVVDVNGGYINRVKDISFEGGTKPIRSNAILTTKEQINANTDTEKVAGATAVKAMISEINSNLNGQKSFNITLKRGYDYKTASGWQNILQWMDSNVRTGYLSENIDNGSVKLHLNNERGDIYINGNSIANIVNNINTLKNSRNWNVILATQADGIHEIPELDGTEVLLTLGYVYRMQTTMTIPMDLFAVARGDGNKILFDDLTIEVADSTHIKVTGLTNNYLLRVFTR